MDAEDNRRGWEDRSGEFSPGYYAELGPNKVSRSLVTALEYYVDEDAAVLELGCSSGRHLAHLREAGFGNLTGIDINDEAFDVMADSYPSLSEGGTFHAGAIEDVLPEFDDDQFDVVYSVETLQHVHPDDEAVFGEIARVTGDVLIITENEGSDPPSEGEDVSYVNDEFPLYYRDWGQVFSDLGFTQVVCKPSKRDTIRVFRA
jgi:SAM-dependent methyltransferase